MNMYILTLADLRLKTHLGITSAERSKKQTVLLHIKIIFSTPPLGCKTGKISDTVCYDTLVKKIQNFCKNKKFKLIEELGMQLFLMVKKNIPKNCKLHLRIAKKPPLRELGHSIFEIGD